MGFSLKSKWVTWIIRIAIGFSTLICLFVLSIYVGLWGKLPNSSDLANIKQAEASLLLDSNENLLGKYFIFDRQMVNYENLPKHLVDALVATEDSRFYDHEGVDYKSLFRVFFKTILLQDDSAGGGSTISQQLVKNIYGRASYGIFSMPVNKIKEMIVATRFEEIYSKQDIIGLYLNTVPFSENTFGIESAAQKFFSISATDLNLSQSATLIGTLKASHSYNPRLFPERSQLRRDVVLQQMELNGYIDDSLKFSTQSQALNIDYRVFRHDDGIAAYFREKIRLDVTKILDSLNRYTNNKDENINLYKDGLKIHTTLDIEMQRYAENSMVQHMTNLQRQFENAYGKNAPWLNQAFIKKHIKELKVYNQLKSKGIDDKGILDSLNVKSNRELFLWSGNEVKSISIIDSLQHTLKFLNTGFVAIEPNSGAVKAYLGGIDYANFKYDHVNNSKRQVGSTFKPIVYTAALENGMDACTYIPVKAMTYTNQKDWKPTNSGDDDVDEHLNYSLEYGLSNSVNTIAVKVLEEVGIEATIEQAQKMGITTKLPKVPSLALGTAELSLMEIATAYTAYANSGRISKPFYISKIEDKDGNIIFKRQNPMDSKEAFSEETRQIMIEIMKSTINSGTAKRIRSKYGLTNDLAGKTGTTQNNKDGWFVAVSPKLVMASWVGNDDHRIGFSNTGIGQGANSALPIVALFLKNLNLDSNFNSITNAKFERPSDEVIAALDCEPQKRDGFLKRLFKNKRDEKEFESIEKDKKKKKNGIFSFLKKNKDN